MSDPSPSGPDTATATRTLVTAGFSITNSRRQPTHIEIHCERSDMFGAVVRYLVVVCDGDLPPENDRPNIQKEADNERRVVVLVANSSGTDWLSWTEFLASLGGAVPSWRALSADYEGVLTESARNTLPKGLDGEAWQVFEDAVADGFEFLFGNRVNRLGGKKRGRRVSDMVTQTPDHHVLVLDAKASKRPFEATWDELRPLVEYTKLQIKRQRGHFEVRAAVLIASSIAQTPINLGKLSGDFVGDVGIPISFVIAEDLSYLIKTLAREPILRSSVNWPQIFGRGGLVTRQQIDEELRSAREGRYARGTPHR